MCTIGTPPNGWNTSLYLIDTIGTSLNGLRSSFYLISCLCSLYLYFFFSLFFVFVLKGEKNQWQMRRSQKVDKQEILSLQSKLQAEIAAKQQMAEEMNKIKTASVSIER